MKKLLILTATLLAGGLTLPTAAQSCHNQGQVTEVFISGYLPCGSPIYSKRIRYGQHYHNEQLSGYELRRYLERQRRIQMQRELERRIARERYIRSRYVYRQPNRCR